MTPVLGVVSLALSVLTSVIAITAVIVQMRSSVRALEASEARQGLKDDKTSKDLTELLVLIRSFMAEQNVINKTVTEALGGLMRKLESLEASGRQTEKMTIESGALVGLLADVLKRRGCVFDAEELVQAEAKRKLIEDAK
jgi:hypothetical protein